MKRSFIAHDSEDETKFHRPLERNDSEDEAAPHRPPLFIIQKIVQFHTGQFL
jgi:hypothetical protein